MRSKFYHPAILIVLCLSFAFIGCGGSDGGSSGDGGTGTTAVEISEDNAADLSTGALVIGQSANIVTLSGASQDNQGAMDSWV